MSEGQDLFVDFFFFVNSQLLLTLSSIHKLCVVCLQENLSLYLYS